MANLVVGQRRASRTRLTDQPDECHDQCGKHHINVRKHERQADQAPGGEIIGSFTYYNAGNVTVSAGISATHTMAGEE